MLWTAYCCVYVMGRDALLGGSRKRFGQRQCDCVFQSYLFPCFRGASSLHINQACLDQSVDQLQAVLETWSTVFNWGVLLLL